MIDYYGMVLEFHKKYGHYIHNKKFDGDKYQSFPSEIVCLREKLITEEAKEFKDWSYENYDTLDNIPVNIIEIADALADLLYVVFGAAIAYGIPIDEVFKEVHRSNMTKSMLKDEKSIKGKTIKGPNYEPPNIRKILEQEMSKDATREEN
jgi:predicted HAD superfamily Cof-like phosphohydrolase